MLLSFGIQTLLYALFFVLLLRYGRKFFAPVDNIVRHVMDLNKNIHDSEPFSVENACGLIEISRRGLFDMLTGLPTRHLFHQQVDEILEAAQDRLYGIFFFDMDRLKPINDNLGHEAGDKALRGFADSLMSFAEEHHGLTCRYGGDEFVLFAPLQRASDITELAEELLKNQRGRVEGRGKSYVYGTSIGICPYPCGAFTFAEALRAADLALYKAKSRGRGSFSVHKPGRE